MKRPLLFPLLALAAIAQVSLDGTMISARGVVVLPSPQGAIGLRIEGKNSSGSECTIDVELASDRFGAHDALRFRLSIAAHTSQQWLIPVPAALTSLGTISYRNPRTGSVAKDAISVTGRATGEPLIMARSSISEIYFDFPSLDSAQKDRLKRIVTRRIVDSYNPIGINPMLKFNVQAFRLRDWMSDYRVLTCTDAIAMTPKDRAEMTAKMRSVLDRYVQAGGSLLLVGGKTEGAGASFRAHGLGLIVDLPGGSRITPEAYLQLHKAVPIYPRSVKGFEYLDEVVEPPTSRALVLCILFYVLAVGPLNYVYLRRKKRLLMLVFTVPALSILASIVVFWVAVLSHDNAVRQTSLVLLDQVKHEAVTVSSQSIFSVRSRRSGIAFDRNLIVEPVPPQFGAGANPTGTATVELGDQQRWGGPFVIAKRPRIFRTRGIENRRERVLIESGADGTKLTNHLGAPIKTIRVRDAAGRFVYARDIQPGESAIGVPFAHQGTANELLIPHLFRSNQLDEGMSFQSISEDLDWKPRMYLAELEGAPFTRLELEFHATRDERTIVVGSY